MAQGFKGLSKTARKAILRGALGATTAIFAEPDAPIAPPKVQVVLAAQAAELQRVPMKSSNVLAAAYAPDSARLFIWFKSGSLYAYEDIPPGMWQGFLVAGSKGQWVYYQLRAKGADSAYAYARVY